MVLDMRIKKCIRRVGWGENRDLRRVDGMSALYLLQQDYRPITDCVSASARTTVQVRVTVK